jgi:hypothetical protein
LKRPPKLQRKNYFENAISRLPGEFSLDSKLVTSSPNCPTLSGKEGPHCPLALRIKESRIENQSTLELGVPGHPKHISDPTPEKLCQWALKENVVDMLCVTTQGTVAI